MMYAIDSLSAPALFIFPILPMSDPSYNFQSLHIYEMPVTRSQAHATSNSRGRNPQSSQGHGQAPTRPGTPGQAFLPPVSPIRGYTGHQYHIQALSPLSAHRAAEGLESNFSVGRVQSYGSGRERYYAFQLRTPVAVRIYEPEGDHARAECSCEVHRVTHSDCAHIWVRTYKSPFLTLY